MVVKKFKKARIKSREGEGDGKRLWKIVRGNTKMKRRSLRGRGREKRGRGREKEREREEWDRRFSCLSLHDMPHFLFSLLSISLLGNHSIITLKIL